jgi:hypothetical protein
VSYTVHSTERVTTNKASREVENATAAPEVPELTQKGPLLNQDAPISWKRAT